MARATIRIESSGSLLWHTAPGRARPSRQAPHRLAGRL